MWKKCAAGALTVTIDPMRRCAAGALTVTIDPILKYSFVHLPQQPNPLCPLSVHVSSSVPRCVQFLFEVDRCPDRNGNASPVSFFPLPMLFSKTLLHSSLHTVHKTLSHFLDIPSSHRSISLLAVPKLILPSQPPLLITATVDMATVQAQANIEQNENFGTNCQWIQYPPPDSVRRLVQVRINANPGLCRNDVVNGARLFLRKEDDASPLYCTVVGSTVGGDGYRITP